MLSLDDYLTVEKAASALGVKKNTLRARIRRKTIASTTIFGARVIHKADVAKEKKKTIRQGRPKS